MSMNAHPRSDPTKRTCGGITFASIPEMDRYLYLRQLQRDKVITKLQYEPTYRFFVNDIHIADYSPDFSYIERETGTLHIEDVKGFKKSKKTGKLLPRVNREFGLKKRLMKALFGIDVEIV